MTREDSIRHLAEKAKSGDRQAFQGLVQRFSSRLENLVRARMGREVRSQVDCEDVVQETWAKAFECIGKLQWQGEEAFFSWLGCMAERVIWRAARRISHAPLQLNKEVPGSTDSPGRGLRRKERFDRLEDALRGLSPDHREVIQLARIETLRIDEIARRMDRSSNAVRKLLARALAELKQGFGDTESLHLPDRHLDLKGLSHDD